MVTITTTNTILPSRKISPSFHLKAICIGSRLFQQTRKGNTAERIVVNLLPIWAIRVSLYQQSPPS